MVSKRRSLSEDPSLLLISNHSNYALWSLVRLPSQDSLIQLPRKDSVPREPTSLESSTVPIERPMPLNLSLEEPFRRMIKPTGKLQKSKDSSLLEELEERKF